MERENMQEKRKCAVVVSLNPCVDKTVWIDKFVYGGTNRVKRAREDVAGKGTNVCVAFQSLEQPSLCVGFDYAGSKKTVAQRLAECGGACEMVTLPGSMRTNMKLFEEETGIMSEVNEKGDPISAETLQELLDLYQKVLENLDESSMVLLSGSIPPGVPADIYYQMIQMAKAHGIRALLDASGEPLLRGVEALPFAMKPNQDEIGQILGRKVETLEEAIEGAKELIGRGVSICCVSLGAEGAVLVTKDHAYRAPALKVEVRGIQGAGDSLVAGMTMALMQGRSDWEALQYAMAAAGGSVKREGTLMCTKEDFELLLEQVEIAESETLHNFCRGFVDTGHFDLAVSL